MKKQEIIDKLKVDKRSVEHILSNDELCERILNENPIKLKDLLKKSDVSKSFIINCINSHAISSFSNAPNAKGRTVFVFEDEVNEVSLIYSDNYTFNTINKFVNSLLVCAHNFIPEKDYSVLYKYFNSRKNLDTIADELGISKERTRQILERGISKLSRRTTLINEVDYIETQKKQLEQEVEFLQKKLDKIKKQNESILDSETKQTLSQISILSKPIEEFVDDISVRLFNCLKAAGINTLMDVTNFSESDFLRSRNFGRKSMNELDVLLRKYEVRLK